MNDSDKQCRFENRIPGISDSNTDLKLFAKAILKAAGKERMCLEQAKHLILAGEQKAIHIGVPMVLAVVDEGGNLTALHRMDGALLASLSIAQAKAFTALALRSPTGESAALLSHQDMESVAEFPHLDKTQTECKINSCSD